MDERISKKDTFTKVDDDKILIEGIQQLTSDSKLFEYIKQEADLYTVNDLNIRYK